MSELKVNSIKGTGASTAAITIDSSAGTCTANITNNLSNRRLTINGDMKIAQRGTSATTDGYGTVDRFRQAYSGIDEAPTQSQVSVASGTTPYSQGFRKAFRITNGNQTSGAGSSDLILMRHRLEAQDIANSGWNYTSSSSFITLSFWCKSSVAQNFYIRLETSDGTAQAYYMETGSLTADTWTKVTKTIPGNSNLQFDNDANVGLTIEWVQFYGTDKTGSVSLDSWAAYSNTLRVPDMTSTWYTTNDATWELTGVQLEVGSVATDFEFRTVGQELQLCKRYYYQETRSGSTGGNGQGIFGLAMTANSSSGSIYLAMQHPVEMRAAPTVSFSGTFAAHLFGVSIATISASDMGAAYHNGTTATTVNGSGIGSPGQGTLSFLEGVSGTIIFSSEL